ncbi:helix-turn-helix domain-containing protein [Bacillus cytotoxicus]|uniref:helix-turn-helix domain-containing protein n=1 Tax=Bacillus cytotoxicus TaxID=580165 RepID=UPI002ABD0742|nr:helix-turn-helix transcriptional regulator [Bacillus cytotoxicus]
MIKCNLAHILQVQNLSITKVSKDTGLSRTTLTALANNTSQGIQFDTLNKLLNYLQVQIDELIIFTQEYDNPFQLRHLDFFNNSSFSFILNWNHEPHKDTIYVNGEYLIDLLKKSLTFHIQVEDNLKLQRVLMPLTPMILELLVSAMAHSFYRKLSTVMDLYDEGTFFIHLDGLDRFDNIFAWKINVLKDKEHLFNQIKRKYSDNTSIDITHFIYDSTNME